MFLLFWSRMSLSEIVSDTHPDAEMVQADLYRRMSPQRKLALVEDANHAARVLAMAGLRMRHPKASSAALERLLADLVLGEKLAGKVYGPRQAES